MLVEARRRSSPVTFVSAAISERSTARLRSLGIAGRALFGEGIFALPQSEAHAARFESLGVPQERIRIMGDLKAAEAARGVPEGRPFASRPALIFGSLRPGEEGAALRMGVQLERHRVRTAMESGEAKARQDREGIFEGRSRALLVIAPRHADGEAREQAHADRERSLVEILRRGRDDGSFPLADPESDAIAFATLSRPHPV